MNKEFPEIEKEFSKLNEISSKSNLIEKITSLSESFSFNEIMVELLKFVTQNEELYTRHKRDLLSFVKKLENKEILTNSLKIYFQKQILLEKKKVVEENKKIISLFVFDLIKEKVVTRKDVERDVFGKGKISVLSQIFLLNAKERYQNQFPLLKNLNADVQICLFYLILFYSYFLFYFIKIF